MIFHMSRIKVLISAIGKWNDHVEQFLLENSRYLKRVYIIHTLGMGIDARTGEEFDYGKEAKKFLAKMKRAYKGKIEFISVIINDAYDIHETQIKIGEIVNLEKTNNPIMNTLDEIALDFTGGTNVMAAAQIFAAYKFAITPYYVLVKNKKEPDIQRVQKVSIDYDLGKGLSKKALNLLKTIVSSTFTAKPDGHDQTPDGYEEYRQEGSITRKDLEWITGRWIRAPESSIKLLKNKNYITIDKEYPAYVDVSDEGEKPEWEMEMYNLVRYTATPDGLIVANFQSRSR